MDGNVGNSQEWNINQGLPDPYGTDSQGTTSGEEGDVQGGVATKGVAPTSFSTLMMDEIHEQQETAVATPPPSTYTAPAWAPKLFLINDDPWSLPNASPPPKEPEGPSPKEMGEAYAKHVDLAVEGYQPPLTDAQKQWVQLKLLDPNTQVPSSKGVDPTFIESVVALVQSRATGVVQQMPGAPANWTPQVDGSSFNTAMDLSLESVIKQAEPDPKKQAALTFAYYHPERSNPEALQQLNSLGISQATNALFQKQTGVGIPEGWKPDSTAFDEQVTESYDLDFTAQLSQYASANQLSDADQQLLTTMHYHPEVSGDSRLQGILAELNGKALDKVGLSGVLSNTSTGYPAADVQLYDGAIRADYRMTNETNLSDAINKAFPPLFLGDEELLRKVMEDPNTPAPDHIQKMAAAIKAQTIQEISAKYGIPETTWMPVNPAPNVNTSPLWTGSPTVKNGIQYLQDMQKTLQSAASLIPNGQGQVAMQDYLRIIGQAIQKAQSMVYAMESSNAERGKSLSQAQGEAMTNEINLKTDQIKKQKEQQDAINKAHGKSSTLNTIMTVLGAVAVALTVVATIASFGTLGPVAAAVIIGFSTMSVLNQAGIPATQKLFEGVGKVFEAMGLDADTSRILGTVLTLVVVLVATRNPDAVVQTFGNSTIVTDIALKAHASEQTAMIIGMVVNSTVMAGGMIAGGLTSSGGRAKIANQLMAKIAKIEQAMESALAAGGMVGKVVAACLKVVLTLFKFSARALTDHEFLETSVEAIALGMRFAEGGTGVAQAYFDSVADQMKGTLEKNKADAEAGDLVLQAVIDALKAEIQQLQTILQSLVTWNASISETQQNKWITATDILSQLYQK